MFGARHRQSALLALLCLLGIFIVSLVLDNTARPSYLPPAAVAPPPPPPPPPRQPRLAAMVLANRDPSHAVRQFVSSYVGSRYDLFVLVIGDRPDIAAAILAIAPNATLLDVSAHFDGALLVQSAATQTCSTRTGYHLMCRFMSGPVYWLREFDDYDQVLRFDDDSQFTAPITQSLELIGGEAYAYALKQMDNAGCVFGEPDFAAHTRAASADLPPSLPPSLPRPGQLPGGLSRAGALAV